jgi:hypothetical protein
VVGGMDPFGLAFVQEKSGNHDSHGIRGWRLANPGAKAAEAPVKPLENQGGDRVHAAGAPAPERGDRPDSSVATAIHRRRHPAAD